MNEVSENPDSAGSADLWQSKLMSTVLKGKVGVMRRRIALLSLMFLYVFTTVPHTAYAENPCGLSSMTETTTPVYPPIAYAAHVQGPVVMLVTFKTTGAVESVSVVSGPEMLRASSISYVQGWRANPFNGPRACPIVIDFHRQEGNKKLPTSVRLDLQHVIVNSPQMFIQP